MALPPSKTGRTRNGLLAWLLLLACAPALAAPRLDLSPDEQAWLAAHPVIRLGVDAGYAPYSFFDEAGRFTGVAAGLIARIEALLGIRMEPIRGLSWAQILKAARTQRLDVVATAVRLPERDGYLNFTSIYIPTPLVVMTREETPRLADPATLQRMRVALVRGYSSTRQALARYPAIQPSYVETPLAGLRALSVGEVDAYVGVLGVNTYLARHEGITNLKVNAAFDMHENGQRLAVRKDWPQLARLLDRALRAIPEADRTAIFRRWLPVGAEEVPVLGTAVSLAQRRWIDAHPRLRVGIARANHPFDFLDPDGQPAGIAVDLLRSMQDRSGLEATYVAQDDRARLLERLRRGELDLVVTATDGGAPPNGLLLTRPFHRSALVIFATGHAHYTGASAELYGKRVAVRRQGLAYGRLARTGRIQLRPVPGAHEALEAVAQGTAEVAVLEGALGLRELEVAGLHALRAEAPLVGGEVALRFAVRASQPDLARLLNHLTDTITPEERSLILGRWLAPPNKGLDRTLVLRWAAGIGLAVVLGYLLILLWNRQLRIELERRQRSERTLLGEREHALDEARTRQAVLESVFQSLPDLFFRLDADGTIRDYRASLESELYVPPEAFLGRRMQDVLPAELGEQFRRMRALARSSDRPVTYEYDLTVPKGERRFEARLNRLAGGDQLIALVRDITGPYRERQARLAQAERLRLILGTTLDGYILADARGAIQDVNPAYCEIVGYPREELLRMNIADLEASLSEDEIQARIAAMLAAGRLRFETRHRHRDGHAVDLEVSISIATQDGNPLVAAFVRDVSDRKRAELALRQAHHELERRVAQRTAELSAANRELESFSYAVSHDLRAPLRAIQGFHQALLEDCAADLPERARDYLNEIRIGGQRMGELIDGLLALSRSTRGELAREPVQLDALAREVQAHLAQLEPERQVALEVRGRLAVEAADPRLAKTLMQNLLENAWKYTARVPKARISLYSLIIGGEQAWCIEDNGAGFDMAFANKLFEPFQRLHHQSEYPGIGIGLATVQRIVHRHGGWIRGEGRPGEGARFCFTLAPPISEQMHEETPAAASRGRPPG